MLRGGEGCVHVEDRYVPGAVMSGNKPVVTGLVSKCGMKCVINVCVCVCL